MRFEVLSIVLVVLAGCTCGSDSTQGAQIPRNVLDRPQDAPKRKFDEKGDLIESANRVKGLPMPEGLGEATEYQGTLRYRTHLPIDRLVRYFDTRLTTNGVEKRGKGAVFHKGRYKKESGDFVGYGYDVTVLPAMGFTIVSVIAAPPPTGIEPDVKELERQYKEIIERGQ